MTNINIGDILTCCETGKQFTAQRDGCSVNYATDRDGNIYSDEGVDIREKRALLDRSKPFGCYISGDNAARITWQAAKDADFLLLDSPDKLEAMRAWAKSSGGWGAEEIAAWSPVELNALFIQLVSSDMRAMCEPLNGDDGSALFEGVDGQVYYCLEA